MNDTRILEAQTSQPPASPGAISSSFHDDTACVFTLNLSRALPEASIARRDQKY